MREFLSRTAGTTVEVGRMIGELLMPGDFLALVGDLGAGKTQFAKGVALGLMVSSGETVCSPSYTILNIHQGRFPLYHFDLYRLTDPGQIAELGFDEYFDGDGICLVEWAGRLGDQIRSDTLEINFTIEGEEQRRLSFHPTGERSCELLRLISSALTEKSV